jgi:hypothetical protein
MDAEDLKSIAAKSMLDCWHPTVNEHIRTCTVPTVRCRVCLMTYGAVFRTPLPKERRLGNLVWRWFFRLRESLSKYGLCRRPIIKLELDHDQLKRLREKDGALSEEDKDRLAVLGSMEKYGQILSDMMNGGR